MSPLGQLFLHLQLVSTSLLLATRPHPKHVHQLRINTRRAMAVLIMFEKLFDPKDIAWMTNKLHRIRRAAGNARDLDVLMERYATGHGTDHRKLLRRIRKDRCQSQGPIEHLQRQLIESERLQQRITSLMDVAVSGSLPSKSELVRLMHKRLEATSREFLVVAQVVEAKRDAKSLHQLRIRSKELRYVMEFCNPILIDNLRDNIYPIVVDLQSQLGRINDQASASRRFSKWQKSEPSPHWAKLFCQQRSKEKAQLRKSINKFKKWWTPGLVNQIEDAFRSLQQRCVAESNGSVVAPAP